MADVLTGEIRVDISHEGGEFMQILLGEDDDEDPKGRQKKYKDRRTRRDRLERRQEGFRQQLDVMTNAFMRWEASSSSSGLQNAGPTVSPAAQGLKLQVVDVFGERAPSKLEIS